MAAGERRPGDPTPGEEAELRSLLRGLEGVPGARPAYREQLRELFVGGGLPGVAESLSPASHPARIAPGVIEETLRESLPLRPARDTFRQELRRRFCAGELAASERGGSESTPARSGGRPVLRVLVGTLAAAAAVLIVTILAPRDPTGWRAEFVGGESPVRLGGEELASAERIGTLFGANGSLESLATTIDFRLGDELRIRVQPGSVVATDPLPTWGGTEPIRLHLTTGEVYIQTARGYDGPPIVIDTPDLEARVTGTTLGVQAFESGSCVCVAEGAVDVISKLVADCPPCVVPASTNRRIWKDGGEDTTNEFPADLASLPEEQRAHVRALFDFAG